MTLDNFDFNPIDDKDCGAITCHITSNPQIAIIRDETGIVAINRTEAAAIHNWLARALGEPDCNNLAIDVSNTVLNHIDTMYPDVWKNVPRTARISIRNTIIREINNSFQLK